MSEHSDEQAADESSAVEVPNITDNARTGLGHVHLNRKSTLAGAAPRQVKHANPSMDDPSTNKGLIKSATGEQMTGEQGNPEEETFDPSGHTIAEVEEYLAGADDAERERVLAAERDGDARKGLLG